jgi:hypothetical protein
MPFNLLVRSFHIQIGTSHVIQQIQIIHNSIYFRILLSNIFLKKTKKSKNKEKTIKILKKLEKK